jgi:sugar-specific transcriptional regulator TrmB
MKLSADCIQSLSQMGFTDLESRIYLCLLQQSPATGYRVAKEIGSTNASIYKALESLEAKGAVLVDDARTRLCRAVPYEELFDQMERRLRENRITATESLRKLRPSSDDDRIYQLRTIDQVYGKCRSMLGSARKFLTIDIFPKPLSVLRDAIRSAASQCEKVMVQVYEPTSLDGVELFLHRKADHVLSRWPVHWISMTADGKQNLLAAIEPEGDSVLQALWTASPVLSWAFLSYSMSEFEMSKTAAAMQECRTIEELRLRLENWLDLPALDEIPGYRILLDRFSGRAE